MGLKGSLLKTKTTKKITYIVNLILDKSNIWHNRSKKKMIWGKDNAFLRKIIFHNDDEIHLIK